MEKLSYCTVSGVRSRLHPLWLGLLTAAVVLVHGYHPWAEDGGLYVAGVEHLLDPALFPKDTAFVTEHLRYSVFAPLLATVVRVSHLSLAAVLFGSYLLSTALMLYAALRLAERCILAEAAQWTAVSLLAAWWTLPIAGTSLLLMDPYVTARSFSTPLSLLAVGAALDPWSRLDLPRLPRAGDVTRTGGLRSPVLCTLSLFAAALFHPLMAGYALGFVVFLRPVRKVRFPRGFAVLSALAVTLAALLQIAGSPASAAATAAVHSRYYWFLAEWQWYEWMGLLGPVAILAASLRWRAGGLSAAAFEVCRAGLMLGMLAASITMAFAQEHFRSHTVASLQPLRAFLLIYVAMICLLGGLLGSVARAWILQTRSPWLGGCLTAAPSVFIFFMAITMFDVQRDTFPASIHVESPGRDNPNPWVKAFLWVRTYTPKDAVFAMDARYVNTRGEDAQTFRAIAQRSAIPDFSKDGGEAAIAPLLAPRWQTAATATGHLSALPDAERDSLLRPFGVDWMVLRADAVTSHPCPYRNETVKICALR